MYVASKLKKKVLSNDSKKYLVSMTDLNGKTAGLEAYTSLLLTPEEHSFIGSTVESEFEAKLPIILNKGRELMAVYADRQRNFSDGEQYFSELVSSIDHLRQNRLNFSVYGLPLMDLVSKIYKGKLIIPDTATISDMESIKLSPLDLNTGKILKAPYFSTGNISFAPGAAEKYGF